MIPEYRDKFNSEFTQTKYEKFLNDLNNSFRFPTEFPVAETPIFITDDVKKKLTNACNSLIEQISRDDFYKRSTAAIPKEFLLPNETVKPFFVQFDFALVEENGTIFPKLIELQGFPTVYVYQAALAKKYKEHFDIPDHLTNYFNGYDGKKYLDHIKNIIVGDHNPENVILLEIDPEEQKTRIDFAATESVTGIRSVCISDLTSKGHKLYYHLDGNETPVERIYNRVIFDELARKNVELKIDLKNDFDVEWTGHPNWFYRISKFSLPLLKGEFTPNSFYLKEIENYPNDLNNYVLKPLFSFAGLGVEIDLNKEMLDKINDKENYILQEKVNYAPLIKTPDGYSKVEIRMMFFWDEEPVLVNNLVRLSKGKMMGVDHNKNQTWVGSSIAYF